MIPLGVSHRRNYELPPWCYVLWGVPAVIALAASSAHDASVLSTTATGALWTLSVAWAGVGCLINGRSCGRVHCRIDGVLLPALAVLGALNVLSVVSFSWNLFCGVFFVGLLSSFIPELVWKRYS